MEIQPLIVSVESLKPATLAASATMLQEAMKTLIGRVYGFMTSLAIQNTSVQAFGISDTDPSDDG